MSFKQNVIQNVIAIPFGRVASYGQIAALAGNPRAARQVGWILNKLDDLTVPWWRVVNNTGNITIKGSSFTPNDQKERLKLEGIEFTKELEIDMKKYRWNSNLAS